MSLQYILEQSGLPLFGGVMSLYYGIRLWLTHNSNMVRGRAKTPVKDEKAYSELGGLLIIGLGVAMLVMAVILLFSAIAAVIEICVMFGVFAVLWKKLNDKYGSV